MKRSFGRTALLLALAAVALVPGAAPSHAQAAQLVGELPEPTLTAVRAEVDAARAAGLPTEALMLKALEGRSKGASHTQIVAAVRALRDRLRVAAGVFGPDRGADVLEAAAAALYAGSDEKTLRALARTGRPDAVGMALVVLGDLVRGGVPVTSAESAVLSLAQAGADARALDDFRRHVDGDIRTGMAPKRATELRLRGVLVRFGGDGRPE